MSKETGTTADRPDVGNVLHRKIDEECFGAFLSCRLAHLTPEQVQSAKRWFIRRIAHRAIEIVKEKDNGNGSGDNS